MRPSGLQTTKDRIGIPVDGPILTLTRNLGLEIVGASTAPPTAKDANPPIFCALIDLGCTATFTNSLDRLVNVRECDDEQIHAQHEQNMNLNMNMRMHMLMRMRMSTCTCETLVLSLLCSCALCGTSTPQAATSSISSSVLSVPDRA